jgi:hypothetical protein
MQKDSHKDKVATEEDPNNKRANFLPKTMKEDQSKKN